MFERLRRGEDGEDLVRGLIAAFERNNLLLFASAISFQIFTAVVPIMLFILGLLGALDLRDVWLDTVRPELISELSPAALAVVDDTVNQVFDSQQLFWITGGAALAVWQVSGAVRAVMDALNRVYGAREQRSRLQRYSLSTGLSAAVILIGLAAIATVGVLPLVIDDPPLAIDVALFVARWGVAAALFCFAVGLVVHHGPDQAQSLGWVTFGTGLVVGGLTLMSGGLVFYLTQFASYGSLFGNLATVVVLAGYIYAASVVFLAGVQIDALLRERHRTFGWRAGRVVSPVAAEEIEPQGASIL